MGCARRECHPGGSGHMAVPVEGAADPLPSPASLRTASNASGSFPSRCRIRNCACQPASSLTTPRFFAAAPARACEGGDGTRESGSLVGERDRCERLTRLLHAQDEKSAVNLRYPGGEILTRKTREQARDRVDRSGASGALLPLARNRGPLLPSWRSSKVLDDAGRGSSRHLQTPPVVHRLGPGDRSGPGGNND